MADEDIAVTIEEDAGATPAGEVKTETPDPVDDLKAQVAEAQAARQREATRAAAAERQAALERNRAQEALTQVQTVSKQAADREGESVDTGIAAATDAIAAAKKEIKTAAESGDFVAMGDAQERLSRASARLERLSTQKSEIEVRRAEAARPKPEVREVERAPDDPVEAQLAEMATQAPRSADWLRQHREFMTDAKKNAKVRAAHFDAVGDGIEPESDAYFEFIETKVGLREKPAEQQRTAPKTPAKRPPVAPVSQSGGGMNGNGEGGTTVRLTKNQAAAATDGTLVWNYPDPTGKNRWKVGEPIGINEMARRVHEQTKQGLYDPNNIQA